MADPIVTSMKLLSIQVCVPKDWSDEQITFFANAQQPCGTRHGWQIRRQGDPLLAGDDERVPCDDEPDNVHVMIDLC